MSDIDWAMPSCIDILSTYRRAIVPLYLHRAVSQGAKDVPGIYTHTNNKDDFLTFWETEIDSYHSLNRRGVADGVVYLYNAARLPKYAHRGLQCNQ